MVLHHIAQGTRTIVIIATLAHAQLLGYRYLYVFNIVTVPYRFQYRVSKTESHNILYRFFTQIMVYAVYLLFIVNTAQQFIQLFSGFQIMPKRLFYYNTCP